MHDSCKYDNGNSLTKKSYRKGKHRIEHECVDSASFFDCIPYFFLVNLMIVYKKSSRIIIRICSGYIHITYVRTSALNDLNGEREKERKTNREREQKMHKTT